MQPAEDGGVMSAPHDGIERYGILNYRKGECVFEIDNSTKNSMCVCVPHKWSDNGIKLKTILSYICKQPEFKGLMKTQ